MAGSGNNYVDVDDQISPAEEKRRRAFSGGVSREGDDSSDGSAYNMDRIEVRDGYPVRYKCLDAIQEQVDADFLQVSFKYEMVVPKDSSVASNLRALEWSILWNIVKDIGLNRCDFTKQSLVFDRTVAAVAQRGGNGLRRMQTDADGADAAPSYILSLTSDGEDTVDRDIGSCRYTQSIESSAVCIPVEGSMQILYTGYKPELVEEFLLEEIRRVMFTTMMRVEDVQGVTFVGQEVPDAASAPTTGGNRDTAVSPNGLLVSVSIGLAVVIVIALFVTVALRRKRKRAFQTKGLEGKEIGPDLQEVPTTSTDASEAKPENPELHKLSESSDEPWEPLQPPMDVEKDGVIHSVQPGVAPTSVYLASTRQRKRKKGKMKKKKSLRERASAAPLGIDSIPEADGDFNSALYDLESPESEDSVSSEEEGEDDDQRVSSPIPSLPNASPPTSPHIFYSASSTSPERSPERADW
ncbi:hypothetical protein MHU86_13867 [Fragilaria crotonensis]|nr:hypothetical protein MHU86_13867 [Fragilaria crotonensis]